MMSTNRKWLLRIGGPLLILLSGVWLAISFRFTAIPFYILVIAMLVRVYRGSSFRPLVIATALFILVTLQPLDITFRSVPGSPRLVPYVMGLPTAETRERAESGEFVLGGCVVNGLEPRWVLVW